MTQNISVIHDIHKELHKQCLLVTGNWDEGKICELLQHLDELFDRDLLKSLKAGLLLDKIRKKAGAGSRTNELCSSLIQKMKGLSEAPQRVSSRPITRSISKEMADTSGPLTSTLGSGKVVAAIIIPVFPTTNLQFRNDWRAHLLTHCFLTDTTADPVVDIGILVANLEETIFKKIMSGVDAKQNSAAYEEVKRSYNRVLRTKSFNLKSNATLRHALMHREISVECFVDMTPKQMLSKNTLENIEKKLKLMSNEKMLSKTLHGTTRDDYTCERCHSKKTSMVQLQLRSGDEPMTTFVTCVTCSFRWRIIED